MEMETSSYGMRVRTDMSYEEAVAATREALKGQGFGVLTEIDVRRTLKEKLDKEFRRYVILGACNPPLAHRALDTELEIGLLLPCNVIVYEEGSGAVVAALDPEEAMKMVENQALAAVAKEARSRLEQVLKALV